jgi:hypothetical protein
MEQNICRKKQGLIIINKDHHAYTYQTNLHYLKLVVYGASFEINIFY